MNILHITTVDMGGAYKSVKRINECMNLKGIDSKILLRNKENEENVGNVYLDHVYKILNSKIKNGFNLIAGKGNITRELYGSNILKNKLVVEADIIFIHWINSFITIKMLERLLETGKKVIIFLHDTWFYTGGCHVNLDCQRYMRECGCCPLIKNGNERDISYKNFKEKKCLFKKYHLEIIGPGNVVVTNAKKSPILENQKIYKIGNPIDLEVFHPYKTIKILREKYNFSFKKKIILFGADFNGTKNKEKGFEYLIQALKKLNEEYMLIVFGRADEDILKELKQEYYLFGYIREENKLSEIYALSDVYVTPSLQESFGYTILEAMACGTPVVAFPNGGSEDLIIHKENGYLAEYKSVDDLAKGIRYCVENKNDLSINAIRMSNNYSYERIGNIYKRLLINNN